LLQSLVPCYIGSSLSASFILELSLVKDLYVALPNCGCIPNFSAMTSLFEAHIVGEIYNLSVTLVGSILSYGEIIIERFIVIDEMSMQLVQSVMLVGMFF